MLFDVNSLQIMKFVYEAILILKNVIVTCSQHVKLAPEADVVKIRR